MTLQEIESEALINELNVWHCDHINYDGKVELTRKSAIGTIERRAVTLEELSDEICNKKRHFDNYKIVTYYKKYSFFFEPFIQALKDYFYPTVMMIFKADPVRSTMLKNKGGFRVFASSSLRGRYPSFIIFLKSNGKFGLEVYCDTEGKPRLEAEFTDTQLLLFIRGLCRACVEGQGLNMTMSYRVTLKGAALKEFSEDILSGRVTKLEDIRPWKKPVSGGREKRYDPLRHIKAYGGV